MLALLTRSGYFSAHCSCFCRYTENPLILPSCASDRAVKDVTIVYLNHKTLALPGRSKSHDMGWIELADQFSAYPFIQNLHFADKRDLLLQRSDTVLDSLHRHLESSRTKYKQFLRQKKRYPSFDAYACFQPFNEAFKALYPFVDYIRSQLNEGDRILNLWDRSGWTASMLAGWFPGHEVVTVWEGDKDILGYRGFDYWTSPERRSGHTIVFTDFLRPLPFEDNSFGAVFGLDLLHRFNQPEILTEVNRVAKQYAPILFPHVHLTNSMPDPFFERGCRQLHGNDYQQLFDRLQAHAGRKGYVVSEPATFLWNEEQGEESKRLTSEPANNDYNACILWLDATSEPLMRRWKGHEQDNWREMYLLQNPLLQITRADRAIELRNDDFRIYVNELLETHPVYVKRIEKSTGRKISEQASKLLYCASQGMNLGECGRTLQIDDAGLKQLLAELYELDMAQAVPVDQQAFRLQHMLGQQEYLLEDNETNLLDFWKNAVNGYKDENWIAADGEDFLTYSQADELIGLVRSALVSSGLKKGDRLLMIGDIHTELLITFWAAVSEGIVVVPVSPQQASARLKSYIDLIQPAFILAEPSVAKKLKQDGFGQVIMLDIPEDECYDELHSFSSWLEEHSSQLTLRDDPPKANDIAVILFTTGSTGNPKGIPLSHAQVVRSGRIMTETYHWKKSDKYFAFGGLETMSGLRHATVSIAEVGASAVIPNRNSGVFDHLNCIRNNELNIIAANPAYFKQLLLASRSGGNAAIKKIRLALCTGNQLRIELRNTWKEFTGNILYNYYGLTETSGICIAEPLNYQASDDNSIGFEAGCITKIVDADGREVKVGAKGELCIFGNNIFNGYYQNDQASKEKIRDGWFHTGDLAIRNSDGSISLAGRMSDIVKLTSGVRIEVSAIEDVIERTPNLVDWAVCPVHEFEKESVAVFFVPESHDRLQETVEAIRTEINSNIGAFAMPSIIASVDSIPRGNHNKILKKELLQRHFNSIKNS